jgi:hypothetical protein
MGVPYHTVRVTRLARAVRQPRRIVLSNRLGGLYPAHPKKNGVFMSQVSCIKSATGLFKHLLE